MPLSDCLMLYIVQAAPVTSKSHSATLGDIPCQIHDPVRVHPLVIIPRHDLDHIAVNHKRRQRIHDRRAGILAEIDGDQRLLRITQDDVVRRVLNAAFTSALVTCLFSSATKSTMETVGVGTRIAIPVNLPFSSGITLATASAAPVVVGMMDCAAALARRRSLCGRSRIF